MVRLAGRHEARARVHKLRNFLQGFPRPPRGLGVFRVISFICKLPLLVYVSARASTTAGGLLVRSVRVYVGAHASTAIVAVADALFL